MRIVERNKRQKERQEEDEGESVLKIKCLQSLVSDDNF